MLLKKIKDIQNTLNQKFFEREREIEGLILALLSRQNVLLIGLPGTAKSALISELSKAFSGSNYFQWLLTKYTTPEELFGPVSLKELEIGVYKRNTANKLPEAHIAFLDEIFKSNSAILNALLTLINERIFYNNGGIVETKLISLIGASNEYPEEEGLEALFDRFLLRFELGYLNEGDHFKKMLKNQNGNISVPTMTLEELGNAQQFVSMIQIPEEVFDKLIEIREDLAKEGITPSDRRFKQSMSLLQAKAFLDGRQTVNISDILILQNALWEEPSQKNKTMEIVQNLAVDTVTRILERVKLEVHDLQKEFEKEKANGGVDLGNVISEVNSKLAILRKELETLKQQNPARENEIQVKIQELIDLAKSNSAELVDF